MEKDEAVKAYTAWATVCLFWGTTYLGNRIAVQHLPPALFAYINPVIAVLLGWLILGERLDGYVAAATGLVMSGVFLVKSSRT